MSRPGIEPVTIRSPKQRLYHLSYRAGGDALRNLVGRFTMAKQEWINSRICPTALCVNERQITRKKNNFDSNMIQKRYATLLQRLPKDYYAADVDRSKCLHTTLSNALFCMHYFGKVIENKFSHVSYMINGENVTVMLAFYLITDILTKL